MNICRICNHQIPKNLSFLVPEMMFGKKKYFPYFQCDKCGCLQIDSIPNDLQDYYADGYYSLKPLSVNSNIKFVDLIKIRRFQFCMNQWNFIGAIARLFFGQPELVTWFRTAHIGFNDRILDVGCGNGRLLIQLATYGFSNLHGIDPFLDKDILYPNGVIIRKQNLENVQDSFDLITLNHSLEHFRNPLLALRECYRILKSGGIALVRIPVVDSFAWQKYRKYWVQLDAPRHLHIPARRTMAYLAESTGFKLEKIIDDSHAMQFWGSEQYQRGIALCDPRSYMRNPAASIFTTKQIAEYSWQSKKLNRNGQGDQACFFLRKV